MRRSGEAVDAAGSRPRSRRRPRSSRRGARASPRRAMPSITAIQRTMRKRCTAQPARRPARARFDRARARSPDTASTVPRRCGQPGAPEPPQRPLRSLGVGLAGGRARRATGPAPVTSARKAPAAQQLLARAARRRGRSAAARRGRAGARRRRARREALRGAPRSRRAAARVEGGVDVGGRRLGGAVREEQRRPSSPAAGRAARARCRRPSRAAGRRRGRRGRRRRGRPRAGAARSAGAARAASRSRAGARSPRRELPPPRPAATGMRFSIRTRQRGSTPAVARRASRARRATSVSPAKPSTRRPVAGSSSIRSASSTRWRTVSDLVLAVVARRADDEREVDLGRRAGAAHLAAPPRARRTRPARAPRRALAAGGRSRASASAALLRAASPASASEFGSVLRRCAKAASTTSLHVAEVRAAAPCGGRRRAPSRRSAAAGRPSRETGWKPRPLGGELDEHRDGAVRLRRRHGEEPVGDLALHHHAPEPDRSAGRRGSRRRAASRRCTAGSRRASSRRRERGEVEPRARRRSASVDVRRRASRRRGSSDAVELDGVDVRDAVGEIAREHAEAGADLEHDVVRRELGEAADHAEDVLVDEEVLAELLLRGRTVTAAPRRSAFRVDLRLELGRLLAARGGERGERVDDVRGLVRPAADGLRREVGRVGLGEDPVGRNLRRRVAELGRLRVGDVAGERDVPAALERGRQQARATRSSAGRPCRRSRRAPRAVSSSAARVWITTGLPSSAASVELRGEEAALGVARRVVAEVVEPGLADRDRLRVREQARAARRGRPRRPLRGLVRVDAEDREDAVVALRELERRAGRRRWSCRR